MNEDETDADLAEARAVLQRQHAERLEQARQRIQARMLGCAACGGDVPRSAQVDLIDGKAIYFCSNACRTDFFLMGKRRPPSSLDHVRFACCDQVAQHHSLCPVGRRTA